MSDRAQMQFLDTVVERVGQPGWRLWDRRALITLALVVLWALVAHIDRVVTAPAKVIPIDKVKVIQHLEGGIVKELPVKEGQPVKKVTLWSSWTWQLWASTAMSCPLEWRP